MPFIIEIAPMNLCKGVCIRVLSEKAATLMIEKIAHFDPLGVANGLYKIYKPTPRGFDFVEVKHD